ncbi:MAG: hypothetical protein BWZ02_00005 [Lentisphaerae bacterium ADurb.BinA184]|nr:MAG: hypothetical protein BWZ02_00005 [Lentisphaerae bacterium ADurb.BinA184]
MGIRRSFGVWMACLSCVLLPLSAPAVLFTNFSESGSQVNGFQDDFDGAAFDPAWIEIRAGAAYTPGTLFSLTGAGAVQMNPATGDPNKLLLSGTYDALSQNVLALIRVVTDPSGDTDAFRGGVTAGTVTGDSYRGICLHHREPGQGGNGNHFNLLNDGIVWGSATDPTTGGDSWTVGEWKWLRLVYDGYTAQARIWDAGATPEPTGWDLMWSQSGRYGLAGLVTNSIGGAGVFEVDYVLIQAQGLPLITVAGIPEPATGGLLLGLAAFAAMQRRRTTRRTRG